MKVQMSDFCKSNRFCEMWRN